MYTHIHTQRKITDSFFGGAAKKPAENFAQKSDLSAASPANSAANGAPVDGSRRTIETPAVVLAQSSPHNTTRTSPRMSPHKRQKHLERAREDAAGDHQKTVAEAKVLCKIPVKARRTLQCAEEEEGEEGGEKQQMITGKGKGSVMEESKEEEGAVEEEEEEQEEEEDDEEDEVKGKRSM